MKVAVYGKSFSDSFLGEIQTLFTELKNMKWQVVVYEPFISYLKPRIELPEDIKAFSTDDTQALNGVDLFFSIGGDGTFLDTITFACKFDIPVLGINTGRLGFLSNVAKEELSLALNALQAGRYRIEERTLLEVNTKDHLFGDSNFALNELTLHKKDTASMITIHTYVNDYYLNSYWADGIIVATPTGSTAYSLSCGGPILSPQSRNFIITPIAPHNLNVRPVVVPDDVKIKLKVEGRSEHFLVSLDSRSETIISGQSIEIQSKKRQARMIQLEHQNFFSTIRNKMMWGIDKRN
jgi:NAD+ kinase